MSHYQQRVLEAVAARAAAQKVDPTRHKCFISYHAADTAEVQVFLEDYGTEFIAKAVGVTDEDDFIDSDDTDYIMDRIRTKYLADSSVTIVLVGKCTWARRYVDWEIYSSLRNSKHSTVNGLIAITLPSAANYSGKKLPPRVDDNVSRDADNNDIGYSRWYRYPTTKNSLRGWINDAFMARTSRVQFINNTRDRKKNNSPCS